MLSGMTHAMSTPNIGSVGRLGSTDVQNLEMYIRMRSLLGRVTLVPGGESPMTGGDSVYSIR